MLIGHNKNNKQTNSKVIKPVKCSIDVVNIKQEVPCTKQHELIAQVQNAFKNLAQYIIPTSSISKCLNKQIKQITITTCTSLKSRSRNEIMKMENNLQLYVLVNLLTSRLKQTSRLEVENNHTCICENSFMIAMESKQNINKH